MNFFESSNYLFILVNQGAGGHRFGRIISCLDNVYWYRCTKNGMDPWDLSVPDDPESFDRRFPVAGKEISKYHYDRIVGEYMVPLLGKRIERWWRPSDFDLFYNKVWQKEMDNWIFQGLLLKQHIHWVLHDTPEQLHTRFPNAKFISVIDNDIELVTDRFLKTAANFPVNLNLEKVRPKYLNAHAKLVQKLAEIKDKPTERDLWVYKNKSEEGYRTAILQELNRDNKIRDQFSSDRYLKVYSDNIDIQQIMDFLGSKSIDENYKLLLR